VEGVRVSQPEDIGAVPDKPSSAGRAIHVIGAILVVVVLPVVLMDLLVGAFGANAMFMGLVYGVVGGKLGGTRRMLYLAPVVGAAAGLGAFTAYGWWWVVVLAILGVVAGGGMRWGWLPPLLMLPFAATFATPTSSGRHALAYGVIAGIATLYGVVLARRFKAPQIIEGQRVSPSQAVMVAVVLGCLLAGSSAIGVALGWSEPYWVPEPILLLVLYVIQGKRERIQEKALGTALGAAAAVPVAIAAPPQWVITVIASGSFVLALMEYKKSYWIYYSFYTFAFVLALSSPGNVGTEAAHRGSEILVGIGLLVIGLAIVHALGGWLAKRYPEPVLA
jgi:hypothetical protein